MRATAFVCFLLSLTQCIAQKGFSFRELPQSKKIEVLFEGKLITAYCYFDSTEKPVLFPIRTFSGVTVTRGYPVIPRPGERADHPHQVGLWFTYESVNGIDFWNNSFAIPAERKSHYGTIRFQKILQAKAGRDKASLVTSSEWVDQSGKLILEETTTFEFEKDGNTLIIDRKAKLKASDGDVTFLDVKDGLLGLRLARELEMPSQQQDRFVEQDRTLSHSSRIDNTGVTGMYYNKEGLKGDSTWGKRSAWMVLSGEKDKKLISIGLIDHHHNPGFPTYWHARGYGLFAANPLGQKIFSNGKAEFNLQLKRGETLEFKYRMLLHEGEKFSSEMIDRYAKLFQNK